MRMSAYVSHVYSTESEERATCGATPGARVFIQEMKAIKKRIINSPLLRYSVLHAKIGADMKFYGSFKKISVRAD